MIIGVLAVLAAAVLLVVAVGHDARADDEAVVGAGRSVVLLVAFTVGGGCGSVADQWAGPHQGGLQDLGGQESGGVGLGE